MAEKSLRETASSAIRSAVFFLLIVALSNHQICRSLCANVTRIRTNLMNGRASKLGRPSGANALFSKFVDDATEAATNKSYS